MRLERLEVPIAADEKVGVAGLHQAGLDQQDEVFGGGEVGAHEVFVFVAKGGLWEGLTAIQAEHGDAGLRAAAKPFEGFLEQLAFRTGEVIRRSEAVFGGDGFKVLDDDAIRIAAAEEDAAGFRAAVGIGGKSRVDLLVDAFDGAPANDHRRRAWGMPCYIFELHFQLRFLAGS